MMKVAVLGAGSNIGRDFMRLCAGRFEFLPYGRNSGMPLESYGQKPHDAVLHCIGGGAAQTMAVADAYDRAALKTGVRYVYLSSGAASAPTDDYGHAKQQAEQRHAGLSQVVDLRVFSYVSVGMNAPWRLVPQLWEALRTGQQVRVGKPVWRDYAHPEDLAALIAHLIEGQQSGAVEAVSRAPVESHALCRALEQEFGLRWRADARVRCGMQHYYSSQKPLLPPRYDALGAVLEQTRRMLEKH